MYLPLGKDAATSVSIYAYISGGEHIRFGCHGYAINNLSCTLSIPAKISSFSLGTWDAVKRDATERKVLIPEAVTSYEQYCAQMPRRWHKTGKILLQDLPEESTDALLRTIHNTTKAKIGNAGSVLFFPPVNYGLPSRPPMSVAFITTEYVKWLMKNEQGSFWGGPVARNAFHSEDFGKQLSLCQPIVWNRYPSTATPIEDTSFVYNPTKAGTNIKDFVLDGPSRAPDTLTKDKDEQELRDMTFFDFKKYSESLLN